MNRYVLLDRDGTLIRDVGYPHRQADYELLGGVAPALHGFANENVVHNFGAKKGDEEHDRSKDQDFVSRPAELR